MKKKTIEPLPPKGSFPGYDRGAAVFNTWAQALLDQTCLMNELWTKMKGGTLKADQGVQALVSTWEYSVGSVEDVFQAFVTGQRPSPRTAPADDAPTEETKKPRRSVRRKQTDK